MKQAVVCMWLAAAAAAQQPPAASSAAEQKLEQYNVVWYSASRDSSGSMPAGNGDIGLNTWVDESGDLLFYISKTDAWSETARLLKLGRVRVKLIPNPYKPGERFIQRLTLQDATIAVEMGKPEDQISLRLWVDANYPAIHLESASARPVDMQVSYERWRDQQRQLEGDETHSAFGLDGGPEPIISYGDSIVLDAEGAIAWYHRNPKSAWPGIMRHQGLGELLVSLPDPLLNRTFGAAIRGEGLARINPTTLRSRTAAQKHRVTITALTATTDDSETWVRQAIQQLNRVAGMTLEGNRAAHERWWDQFWARSFIHITGGPEAKAVSQGYALQRYLNACAGRGAYPIKFNGSIFTVDAKVKESTYDADYRRWGGPYWFQNTRLIYWPMLAAGDFEMMQPLFRMYRDAQMLAEKRTKLYFNHGGAFFPETMYFWGTYTNKDYGWKRDGKPASFVESPWIRNYHSGGIELATMMLDYASYSGDKMFVRLILVPIAEGVIEFYDKHYERTPEGQLRISPAQSLETWQEVVNPLPEIAGLKYLLTGLLAQKTPMSKDATSAARRILSQLPPLPVTEAKGVKILAPAERVLGEIKNRENPELYAIFPYRIYGLDRTDLELAKATFENRGFKQTGGWQQDAVQAAMLGDSALAQKYVIENFTAKSEQRFPAFWGPNFDWTPDQCHGNVASLALQSMLVQGNGERVLVAPAWPADWDVEFRLYAPDTTVVEGAIKGGKIERLKVTPDKRMSDIVRPEAKP